MKNISSNTIKTIVLAVVFGFLSGIFGYAVIGLPFFARINFSDVNKNQDIVIDQPRNVIVQQDLQLKQVENNLFPALINIYPVKKAAVPLNNAYLPAEILGGGFVLTADGWVVTIGKTLADLKAKYEAVGYQEKQYELANFIEDRATGIIFGKMTANNLPVASLGDSGQLTIGQTLVVIYQRKNVVFGHVKEMGYDFKTRLDLVQSADDLNRAIWLDIDLTGVADGAVAANLKGEIVGLVSDGKVIPVNNFKTIINQILDNQKITRPVLGIDYIDLAQTEGLINLGDHGALVYGNPPKTSPAHDKLKDGDVILKVNDVELSENKGLSDLINGYKKGNKIDLLINRAGQEQTVEVILN